MDDKEAWKDALGFQFPHNLCVFILFFATPPPLLCPTFCVSSPRMLGVFRTPTGIAGPHPSSIASKTKT